MSGRLQPATRYPIDPASANHAAAQPRHSGQEAGTQTQQSQFEDQGEGKIHEK